MQKFDVVIVGSGIGGLICGGLLSREGLKVCVLEKNRQIGGALQTYARDKLIFDAAVHYMGGLAPGQNLYQIFKHIGIMDQLRLVRMDEEAFDKILIEGDPREYALAQGYGRFQATLEQAFPGETEAIGTYVEKIKAVCSRFPLYNLRSGGLYQEKAEVLETDAKTYIESLTQNQVLRDVLAGDNILYAGQPDKTPFYVHALILNSFIESSWKCVDGASQLATRLVSVIRKAGGQVLNHAEVICIEEANGRVTQARLKDGRTVIGNQYISSLHPAKTLEMTPSALIKQASRRRIEGLENSVSCFCVNLVLKPGTVPYVKHNYYYQRKGQVWTTSEYDDANWPPSYGLFFSPSRQTPESASSITVVAYMRYSDMDPWKGTFNTTSAESDRGPSYQAFKKKHYQALMDCVSEKFPWLPEAVTSWYASTPLSFRDYLGTSDGSLYGIVKDYREPLRTIIAARTRIPNLFLTGQNLNLHGILGAAISSMATCAELLGKDDFVDRIREA